MCCNTACVYGVKSMSHTQYSCPSKEAGAKAYTVFFPVLAVS